MTNDESEVWHDATGSAESEAESDQEQFKKPRQVDIDEAEDDIDAEPDVVLEEPQEVDLFPLTAEETLLHLERAEAIKQQGNEQFALKRYTEAIAKYQKAIELCPLCHHIEQSAYYANIAACYYKLEKWQDCVDFSTKAVQLNSTYSKARYRRALANEQIGSWQSLQQSQEDFEQLKEAGLAEADAGLARIKPKVEKAAEMEKDEMIIKLKELGNSVLGKFGMSTDMFNMKPDGKGGYSMNYGK